MNNFDFLYVLNTTDSSYLENISIFSNISREIEYYRPGLTFPIPWILVGVSMLLIGIPGNLIAIGLIIYKKSLHNATFTTIALLAVADFVALAVSVTHFFIYGFCSRSLWNSLGNHIFLMMFITTNSSNLHVVILARLRYQLIVRPFKSLTTTPRDMIKLSIVAWIMSSIIAIPYAIYIYLSGYSEFINIPLDVFLFLEIVVPVVTFHILKIKRLKKGRQQRNSVIKTMSVIITVIITMQIILYPVPVGFRILVLTEVLKTTRDFEILNMLANGLFMLNYAVNPIIYFFSIIFYRSFSLSLTRKENVREGIELNEKEAETN